MRIVMHGASPPCYNGVRDDPLGMDLQYAGKNGQVHGNGFYFGLSDHVTFAYNTEKRGTALMGLLLTHENLQPKNSVHYNAGSSNTTLFHLNNSGQGSAMLENNVHNCIVIHESSVLLILGKVVAV